jgi:hypothetical protein
MAIFCRQYVGDDQQNIITVVKKYKPGLVKLKTYFSPEKTLITNINGIRSNDDGAATIIIVINYAFAREMETVSNVWSIIKTHTVQYRILQD